MITAFAAIDMQRRSIEKIKIRVFPSVSQMRQLVQQFHGNEKLDPAHLKNELLTGRFSHRCQCPISLKESAVKYNSVQVEAIRIDP